MTKTTQLGIETSNQLVASFKLDKNQGRFALPTFSLKGSPIQETCPSPPSSCQRYYTIEKKISCMHVSFKGKSSRDTEHWMGHATTWSERPGEAQTQLCRDYCLQSTRTAWKPLVPLTCHLQGKFRQPQYHTRTSESIVCNMSALLVF